jgi:hypothetical protein
MKLGIIRKYMKKFFINLLTLLLLLSSMTSPVAAQTEDWSGVCVGSADLGGVDASEVATFQGLECLIANIFVVIITIIGLAGFVMFIIGSVRWLISGGNSKGIDSAKGTMTYAVVGIVVSVSAFIILNLIANFTGVQTITDFVIPRASDGL